MEREKKAETVGLASALGNFFSHYANFRGRSSRSEYFYPFAFFFIFGLLFGLIVPLWPSVEVQFLLSTLGAVISISIILPFVALSVRRLRDAGLSPYLAFLILVPLGGLALFILAFLEPKTNAFRPQKERPVVTSDLEHEIRRLDDLHRQGLIDDKQLREAKNKALGI